MLRLIKILIFLILLGDFALLLLLSPVLPYGVCFYHAIVDGSPGYSLYEATVLSRQDNQRQQQLIEQIGKQTRMVKADPNGFRLWATPMGKFWVPKRSLDRLGILRDLAEQQRHIYGLGPDGVQAGDVVLDCGANVGIFTRVALSAGAKLVVAIEPAPETLECLRRNFRSEIAQKRVIVYPKGVWDKDAVLPMHIDQMGSDGSSFVFQDANSKNEPVLALTTIDKLTQELGLDRVDFIKMDIEGAEQKALAGARKTLAQYKPRLAISAYHLRNDLQEIPKVVRSAWPAYKIGYGPVAGKRSVRPGILYFHR